MRVFPTVTYKSEASLPENFEQIGHNIDLEIASRLVRCIWRALGDSELALKQRLNAFLSEEVDSIRLQHEIDGRDDQYGLAIATLLEQHELSLID